MNFTRWLLDETIKYKSTDEPKERALNFYRLGKEIGTRNSTVWRQIKSSSNIQAETWVKLMLVLGNFKVDDKSGKIIIKIETTPENKEILKAFKNRCFRGNYDNINDKMD